MYIEYWYYSSIANYVKTRPHSALNLYIST